MKESDLRRQILDHLALTRIFHYRNNSGAFKDSNNHFYCFGALGSPDIICVLEGQYMGIEVKALEQPRRRLLGVCLRRPLFPPLSLKVFRCRFDYLSANLVITSQES